MGLRPVDLDEVVGEVAAVKLLNGSIDAAAANVSSLLKKFQAK